MVITALKAFDIVYVMTNGNFDTEVIANRMYKELFNIGHFGHAQRDRGGAAARHRADDALSTSAGSVSRRPSDDRRPAHAPPPPESPPRPALGRGRDARRRATPWCHLGLILLVIMRSSGWCRRWGC